MMADPVRRLNSTGIKVVGSSVILAAFMAACALIFNGGMWGG
jgi:hypothetical protein